VPREIKRRENVAGDAVVYVPKAYDNDKAPLGDRVIVHYREPNDRDRRRLKFGGDTGRVRKFEDGTVEIEPNAEAEIIRMERAIENNVVKVENYIGPQGPIETGIQFAEYCEDLFFFEVARVILDGVAVSDQEKKDSSESQASCSQETSPSGGIAKRALSKGSTQQETATEKTPALSTSQAGDSNSASAPSAG
jgi:hypothetical protein